MDHICRGDGIAEAALDAGRRVDQDPVEFGRISSHRRTISLGETALLSRVCAAGIKNSSGMRLSRIIAWRSRQRPSMISTRSYTIRFSRTKHYIQVAQADIGVDAHHFVAFSSQRGADIGGGGGFTHAALCPM
jgi:hypothetical protein